MDHRSIAVSVGCWIARRLLQSLSSQGHALLLLSMLARKPIFPNVIELNFQAGQLYGCNVYLVYDQSEWVIIDIGFEESVEELVELIRKLEFPFTKCQTIVATHADV